MSTRQRLSILPTSSIVVRGFPPLWLVDGLSLALIGQGLAIRVYGSHWTAPVKLHAGVCEASQCVQEVGAS